jgi:molybdopterin molybdotransferase
MISFQEARKIVLGIRTEPQAEVISFLNALGRHLAEDIISDVNMPPFNKSAVDGYACKRADLPGKLKLLEIIPAGKSPSLKITDGTCSKIMTGAEIPDGADCVVMVEHSEIISEDYVLFQSNRTSDNICFFSEDVRLGDKILFRGSLIRPQDLAMLASVGKTKVIVAKKPKIGILATGSELVEPDQKPGPGQIRNSNAYQLIGQSIQSGGDPVYLGIAKDYAESLKEMISFSLNNYPITLISGGISMGDFDLVPQILAENKVSILFHKIAIQPGKPTLFGTLENGHFVFGLPGNPVSSFIQFELLVKPFIQLWMGQNRLLNEFQLPLGFDYERKKADRDRWEPGIINETGHIMPVPYNGSGHLHSLSNATIIFCIPKGITNRSAGEYCHARSI